MRQEKCTSSCTIYLSTTNHKYVAGLLWQLTSHGESQLATNLWWPGGRNLLPLVGAQFIAPAYISMHVVFFC